MPVMEQSLAPARAASTLLSGLFSSKPDDLFILIWTRSKKESHWFNNVSKAAEFAASITNDDVYFGVGLSPNPKLLLPVYQAEATDAGKKPPQSFKEIRCRQADIAGIAGVWIDIDIADGIHKKGNLPPDDPSAISLLNECQKQPTFILHSGGGLQAYWTFPELLTDLARASALAERWTDYFKQLAAPYGWDVDATQDLSRVMRVPGTFNHKSIEPRPVLLLEAEGPSYNAADLEAFLDEQGIQGRATAKQHNQVKASAPAGPAGGGYVLNPNAVIDQLDFDALAEINPKFLATYHHNRADFKDTSNSTYDYSLALFALHAGWPQQKVINLLIQHRREYRDPKVDSRGQLRRDYYDRTIGKAIKEVSKTQNNSIDLETGEIKKIVTHHFTDWGNARRLVEGAGQDLRYVLQWGWLAWDGKRWQLDKTDQAKRLAKKTVRAIHLEAENIEDDTKRTALLKFAIQSEATKAINAMLSSAESELEVRRTSDKFDRDSWLLNCLNGTLDLRTGQPRPHDRADLITKLAPVEYDPAAKCPTWLRFLDTIMAGNAELVSFLQQAIGYSLTGDTSEQCLFLCYGTGRNGKSTLLETISALLGDYAQATSFNTFLERMGNEARNDIACLTGARFVKATEADPGRNLAESVIKELTGGDTVKARFLFKEEFSFKPSFKIFLAANHKPSIRGQDEGIWRRIRLIPFEVTIPESQVDKRLPEKLRGELPGILAWAVQGCLDWQRQSKLGETEEITAATDAYKQENDMLQDFLAENCELDPKEQIKVSDLYSSYAIWCSNNDEQKRLTKIAFSRKLAERKIISFKGNSNASYYQGINLTSEAAEELRKARLARAASVERGDLF